MPSASSSDRMSLLVSNSSKDNSGFWWICLLTVVNQLKNSGSLAEFRRSCWGEIRVWANEEDEEEGIVSSRRNRRVTKRSGGAIVVGIGLEWK